MPQVGFVCCDGEKRRFAECIKYAFKCQCPWTAALLQAMAADVRPEQPYLTVTELLGCPRQSVLKKLMDWYETPASAYAKFRGSILHKAIGSSNAGAITEQRFTVTLPNDVTISGQPDLIYPDQHLLLDFKTTKFIPREPYVHHILQLNAYRYLVWGSYKIWNLEVVYFDMSGCSRVPVPLMDLEEVKAFLLQQSSAVTDGLLSSQLPERTGEDGLWQCGYCPFQADCWPQGTPKKVRASAKA